jgi:uncharacterized protein YyaL (SSP411 family)
LESAITNQLHKEKSPYLLQHATNPVFWQAWNNATFERAVQEGKPIFLSIGYATCHWCHVMEHESFIDQETAEILNSSFIAIKVDREERPDIDAVYMEVCQAMNGHGGWPLSIFMTPTKLPFFAGTYFPKESRGGKPSFKDILNRIAEIWNKEQDRVLQTSEQIVARLQERIDTKTSRPIEKTIFADTFQAFWQSFDTHFGGFGKSPKFPTPHKYMFLLRYHKRYGTKEALFMVEKSLQSMRLGGMFDHLGGGFHRYSTDREWILPHFEKMLYDQAMLIVAYAEAYHLTSDPFYKQVITETVDYVTSFLQSPEGGFYSAEDADSEGEEGKYYVWTTDELREVLEPKEFDFAISIFNCKEEGNFFEEHSGVRSGKNILYLDGLLSEYAIAEDSELTDVETQIQKIQKKLFEHRKKRIAPFLDDKILADWNGLFIAALSIAGRICSEKRYIDIAEKAQNFVLTTFLTDNNHLFHRYRDSDVAIEGMLSDYASVAWGLFELYQATGSAHYLQTCEQLIATTIDNFYDTTSHLFFDTSSNASETLFLRMKSTYDGAIPSNNSLLAFVLVKLGITTENETYIHYANQIVSAVVSSIESYPLGYAMYVVVADLLESVTNVAHIVVPSQSYDISEFLPFLQKYSYHTFFRISDVSSSSKPLVNGMPTLYYCTNFSCLEPIVGQNEIRNFLEKHQ